MRYIHIVKQNPIMTNKVAIVRYTVHSHCETVTIIRSKLTTGTQSHIISSHNVNYKSDSETKSQMSQLQNYKI